MESYLPPLLFLFIYVSFLQVSSVISETILQGQWDGSEHESVSCAILKELCSIFETHVKVEGKLSVASQYVRWHPPPCSLFFPCPTVTTTTNKITRNYTKTNKPKQFRELEFNSTLFKSTLLSLQRTGVLLPAPIQWLKTTRNSSSETLMHSSEVRAPGKHVVNTHMQEKHSSRLNKEP